MNTTDKLIQNMNVEELVEELMQRFRDIHDELNVIAMQTSHQNQKIVNLENKVNGMKSLASKMQTQRA